MLASARGNLPLRRGRMGLVRKGICGRRDGSGAVQCGTGASARGHCPVQRPRLRGALALAEGHEASGSARVFSVQDGLIRITGDGFGYLATRASYRDYHLFVEYRWGKRTDGGKFVRNSGYSAAWVGPDGSAEGTWMASIECQLAQGCVGDLIPIPGKRVDGAVIPVRFTGDVAIGPTGGPAGRRVASRGSSPGASSGGRDTTRTSRSCSTRGAGTTWRAPSASGRGSSASATAAGSRPRQWAHDQRMLRRFPRVRQDPVAVRGLRAFVSSSRFIP